MGTNGTVVGAAIIWRGRVLAARRTSLTTVGGWEFPGGKVEPGEEPECAVAREINEELGCAVRVGAPLAGEHLVTTGHVLRVYRAAIAGGEPSPRPADHDALRWLGPEELDEVPWLAADRPFLAELREVLLDGDRFEDGNVGGATRIGMTVRRPTGSWTPAVHRLLEYLDAAGLDGLPRVLGSSDERGREVLTYLPGRGVRVDDETVSDALLADAVRWLRRYHDVVRGFRPAGVLPWRNGAGALGEDEIICHHDPGAYNWVVDELDDRLVGMVDWDMAGPGRPIDDLAFMAWNSLPLFRVLPTADVARRLHLMADSYGDPVVDATTLLAAVDARMTAATDRIAAGQQRGDPGMLNLGEVGEPERTRSRLADLRERLPGIRERLTPPEPGAGSRPATA